MAGPKTVAKPRLVKAKSPYRWLRRLLLFVGLLGIGGIGVLLAAYRFGSTDQGAAPERGAAAADDGTVTSGQGFEFMQTADGRPVLRIQADRSQQTRDGTAYLETVELQVYRQDGEVYTVTSDRAQFNEASWATALEGNVLLEGWENLVMEARALELLQGGQVLVSRGAVEFRYPPNLVGRATQLRLDRRSDLVTLSGGVHIRSTPGSEVPFRLDCERLTYHRGESLIRAIDDVAVRHGEQELETHALTIFLQRDQRTLRTLRARWDVRGSLAAADRLGGMTRVSFRAQVLDLQPSPANPELRKIQLEGTVARPAVVKVTAADGLARQLAGRYLEGQTENGRPVFLEGFGDPLVMDEFLDLEEPYPLRQACARRASARFLPDGSLARIFLDNQVELSSGELHLSGGSHATLELDSGTLEIEGPAVELYNERGNLTAPRISYSKETGLIRAMSGVRASLEAGAAATLARTPFARGQGPVHVEAEEAHWSTEPQAFTFLGEVRAWRGQNLLLADQLRGDQEQQRMSASGGVKTVWIPQRAGEEEAGPIEIVSDRLTYGRLEGMVAYGGEVKVTQDRRSLTCEELSVELDETGSDAERMTCRERVRLIDPVENRRASGDAAVYHVAAEQIEIFGEPMRLVDSQNNQMAGRYLLYDLGAGTVKIRSDRPAGRGAGLR